MKAGRPRVRGNGRRQPTTTTTAAAADTTTNAATSATANATAELKRRTSVNYRHKLDVIEFFLRHGSDTAATVAHFYPALAKDKRRIKMQLVSSWVKQRAKIQQHCESGLANQRNVRHPGQGATLPREVEEQIVEWMHAQARAGVAVTAKMLQQTARELAAECGFEDGVFTASWSWRVGFLRRHFRAGQTTPLPSERLLLNQPIAVPATVSASVHERIGSAMPDASVQARAQWSSTMMMLSDAESSAIMSAVEQPELSPASVGEPQDETPLAAVEIDAESPAVVIADERQQREDNVAMPTVERSETSLAAILQASGLQQYLPVLHENGFESPESLAGIDEYFADLGVKLGHRKRFKDLSIRYTPGMDGVVPFVIVLVDVEARWGWSQRRKFLAKSVCQQQWPKHVSVEVQNLFYGRISAQTDSTIEYASNSGEVGGAMGDEPLRCKGEVVFSTTLRNLYEAGYPIDGRKPIQHRLSLE